MEKDTLRKINDKIAKAGGCGLFLVSGLDSKTIDEIARHSGIRVFGVYIEDGALKAEASGLKSVEDEEKLLFLLPKDTEQQMPKSVARRDDFELDPIASLDLILSQDGALTRDYAVLIDLSVLNYTDDEVRVGYRIEKDGGAPQLAVSVGTKEWSKKFSVSLRGDNGD